MASDDPQRIENGSSRMMFQDEAIHFSRAGGGGGGGHTAPRKAREGGDGGGFGRSQYGSKNPNWNLDDGLQSDGSDGEDEEDDEDDVDDHYDLDENHHHDNNAKNGNNSSCSVQSSSDKGNGEKARNLQERHTPFGLSRGMMGKEFNLSEQQQPQHERVGNYENAITVVQPELYSAQNMNGGDCLGSVQMEMRGENGYGNGGRKGAGMLIDPGVSLRTHLLDPITGFLMDDAMILPCGHSFGSGGMQHVLRMKACCKCSRPVADNSVRENLALRSAVKAFCREEESQSSKVSKRRRDRFEQEKSSHDDPHPMDSRGKGVQFPFVVSDRVIIKGNKRTPQRFVGRVAVVMTQCLNGWYVVKTLDNAESVKLQYRSLAKVPDDSPPSIVIQNKSITPSWL